MHSLYFSTDHSSFEIILNKEDRALTTTNTASYPNKQMH